MNSARGCTPASYRPKAFARVAYHLNSIPRPGRHAGMQETDKDEAKLHEPSLPRDPEDRQTPELDERAIREKNYDKTLADSFPTSDPPSSIPDPADEED